MQDRSRPTIGDKEAALSAGTTHPDGRSMVALVGALFPDLPPDSRAILARLATQHRPAPGAVLMREGRPTLQLGAILEGRLAVRDRIGSDEVTIMTLEPGDIFGWSALLDGVSTASIIALAGAEVVLFERDALRRALDADPASAAVVYRRLLTAVASRLDATRLLMRDVYAGRAP
jgi:CRP-like cAMP-binding protein